LRIRNWKVPEKKQQPGDDYFFDNEWFGLEIGF